jgi:hypothetical protein
MGNRDNELHVGKPHTSSGDPKVHTTLTHRNADGKITSKEHRSSLGAIAIGQANYEAERKQQ